MKLFNSVSSKKTISKKRNLIIILLIVLAGLYLFWNNLPTTVKENILLLHDSRVVEALLEKNDLLTLRLDIPFKNFQKIEYNRKKALERGELISSDNNFVKAEITQGGYTNECKIRLKGDFSDHWKGEKFSLRVEMKGGALIKGMSKFSLQNIPRRHNTTEYLFLSHLKESGCLAINYDFVNLIINGTPKGIYAIEEHFSKEFIESNKKREGLVINFEESLIWKQEDVTNINYDSLFRSLQVNVRNQKKIMEDKTLSRQRDTAVNLLRALQCGSLQPSVIFDDENLGTFLAIVRFWNAEHVFEIDDINFYFNPITSQLEPIGYDGHAGRSADVPFCYFSGGKNLDSWVNFALSDNSISQKYVSHLQKLCQTPINNLLKDNIRANEKKVRNLWVKEIALSHPWAFLMDLPKLIADPFELLNERITNIKHDLENKDIATVYATRGNDSDQIKIIFKNATTQPIEIIGFKVNGKSINADLLLVYPQNHKITDFNHNNSIIQIGQGKGYFQTDFDYIFAIDSTEFESDIKLEALFRFWGTDEAISYNIPLDSSPFNEFTLPYNQSKSTNITYPKTVSLNENKIVIPSGVHTFSKNLIIPESHVLHVESGAKLLFDENCSLISFGQTLMVGDALSPIILTSKIENWAGLFLHHSSNQSVFENVHFSNISGIGQASNPKGFLSNGWNLTGGVTTYNSDIKLNNCSFKNFFTEDALNIISSAFELKNSVFSNVYSDAFDGDFVSGKVSDCKFDNISGDGVDFSGSYAVVENCYFRNIADKAISVGENSRITINNSSIDTTSFGIVSKDSSRTIVNAGTNVKNASTAAFSAFQKKSAFGPASIKVYESSAQSCTKEFMIQYGSFGWKNNSKVATEDFDTIDLYVTP